MAYTGNAASGKVPAFGIPGTITPAGGSALVWDITSFSYTPGSDMVEHRDADGKIVSRTYFNQDGTSNGTLARNRQTTVTITAIPTGTSNRGAAVTNIALMHPGKIFALASFDVGNGNYECTSMSVEGSNTENVVVTLSGIASCVEA